MWATTNAAGAPTLDNFFAATANPVVQALPFADGFVANPRQQLSDAWTQTAGSFTVNGAAVSNSALSQAFVNLQVGVTDNRRADVSVEAEVSMPLNQSAGVLLRVNSTGSTYYRAFLRQGAGNSLTAFIQRVVNGVATTLRSGPAGFGLGGRIRFEAIGTQLRLFVNDQLTLFTSDTVITAAGNVGIYATSSATVAAFSAREVIFTTPTLPYSDAFPTSPGSQLNSNWREFAGAILVGGGLATGQASFNLALLNGINVGASFAEADILPVIGQPTGLALRSNGNNFYGAQVVQNTNGTLSLSIVRRFNGVTTTLSSKTIASGATLRFQATGSTLQLLIDGNLELTAIDSTFATGSIGLYGGLGARWANFLAG
jgi:hypothetical protein